MTRRIKHTGVSGMILLAAVILLCISMTTPIQPLYAQAPQELLSNNGMDSYYGIGGSNVVPLGWTLTSSIPVATAKQQWQFENEQFGGSWHLSTIGAAFTAIGTQFVANVKKGTPLRFSAYANLFTCNQQTSCIEQSVGRRVSDRGSGAKVRVGIDPTGGKDANAATVKWSGFAQPFDAFGQVVIDARSENDAGVTVFLYATQDVGMLLNNVYWDNASLQVLGPGSGGGAGTDVPPPPAFAEFVTPQATQPDGSIIHIVREGDTLSSIAVAYKVTVTQIRELNKLPVGAVIFPGQKLLIKKAEAIYLIVTATPTGAAGSATETPRALPTSPVRPTFGPVIITKTPTP
ncbi:MAG: LysM peptidoglycan-binding domain-containing protein [Anaerolineae bacterium]